MPSFIYSKVIQPGRFWSLGLMFDTFHLERTYTDSRRTCKLYMERPIHPSDSNLGPFCSEVTVLSLDGFTEFLR